MNALLTLAGLPPDTIRGGRLMTADYAYGLLCRRLSDRFQHENGPIAGKSPLGLLRERLITESEFWLLVAPFAEYDTSSRVPDPRPSDYGVPVVQDLWSHGYDECLAALLDEWHGLFDRRRPQYDGLADDPAVVAATRVIGAKALLACPDDLMLMMNQRLREGHRVVYVPRARFHVALSAADIRRF